ncbi:MAG: hypothetical protein ABSA92_10460 [Candidatus Bathyarchaeia archaeon]|jgi:hypothetical protein
MPRESLLLRTLVCARLQRNLYACCIIALLIEIHDSFDALQVKSEVVITSGVIILAVGSLVLGRVHFAVYFHKPPRRFLETSNDLFNVPLGHTMEPVADETKVLDELMELK